MFGQALVQVLLASTPALLSNADVVPQDLESRRQVLIEQALLTGTAAVLEPALREVPYLFPRAIERTYRAEALRDEGSEQRWIDDRLSEGWGEPAHDALLRVAALRESRSAPEARALLQRIQSRLDPLAEDCDALHRKFIHDLVASDLREFGLLSLAYQQELAAVAAIIDGETLRDVEVRVEALEQELFAEICPLAEIELRYRRGQVASAYAWKEQAQQRFLEVLELVGDVPDSRLRSLACDLMAWSYWGQGRHELVEEHMAEAQQVAQRRGDWSRVARMLRSRAQNNAALGRSAESDRQFTEGLQLARAHGLEWRAASIAIRHADTLSNHQRNEEARERLEIAHELLRGELRDRCGPGSRESRMLYVRYLRATLTLESKLQGAEYCMPADIEADCRRLIADDLAFDDLFGLRILYATYMRRSGRLDEAVGLALELQQQVRAQTHYGYVTRVETFLASMLTELGEHEAAYRQMAEALAHWDRLRSSQSRMNATDRVTLSKSVVAFSSEAIRIAYGGWKHAAPGSPERLRSGRVALAFAGYGRALTARQEMELGQPLANFDLEATILEQTALLQPSELLLAFDLNSRVGIAAIQNEIRMYDLPDKVRVNSWVDRGLHELHFHRGSEHYARYTSEISASLLAPVRDWIAANERILCIADGRLARQPIELLFDPNRLPLSSGEAVPAMRDLPYLFREHTVIHLASLGHLPARPDEGERREHSGRVALFAYPHGAQGEALPGVLEEARAIERIHGESRLDLWWDDEASEAALRNLDARDYDVLHLASHVSGDPNSRTRSWIQLAPGQGADGQLLIDEIAQLDLGYALVILSGCSAAEGVDGGAEGLVTVGWGCMCAGARALLMSPFEVSDALAAQLMEALHLGLRDGLAAEDALRDARNHLLHQGSDSAVMAALLPFLLVKTGR